MVAVENQSNIVNVEILLLTIGGNGVREELEIQIWHRQRMAVPPINCRMGTRVDHEIVSHETISGRGRLSGGQNSYMNLEFHHFYILSIFLKIEIVWMKKDRQPTFKMCRFHNVFKI